MIKIEKLVRKNILEMEAYSSARQEYDGKEGIFLDANENPFGKLNRYPDPYQLELKKELAKLKRVSTENIAIGNGSDEVIDLLLRIFCNPGKDKALTFTPSYGMYEVSSAINDVELIQVPLNPDFQIDTERLSPYLNDPSLKVIFICSPNNPTGNVLSKESINYILERFNGIVLIDEAYIDFSSSYSWIGSTRNYNNLVICQTLSKAWGLAGLRIGVAYADSAIIELMNKVKPPYNIGTVNQQLAVETLKDVEGFREKVSIILEERELLVKGIAKLPIVNRVYPTDANFILVEFTDADFVYDELVQQEIITRNRSQEIANSIRITVGSPEENEILMNELKKIADQVRNDVSESEIASLPSQ